MNAENNISNNTNAVRLFRSIFEAAIGYVDQQHKNIMTISEDDFLMEAYKGRNLRKWYIENDGITEKDLYYFDEIMLDYLDSLRSWIKQSINPKNTEIGITISLAQVSR